MKTIKILTLVGAVGLATAGTLLAQDRPERRPGRPGAVPPPSAERPPRDEAGAVEHLTEVYGVLAPFDADNDNKLDDAEKAAVAKAIVEGTIKMPTHRSLPAGAKLNAERRLHRLGHLFAEVAPFDADSDGTLSETEQTALKAAIEKGELRRPGGPGEGRPGKGGRRGPKHQE